jgi:RimJ/RimL family protein N-acetyltransferase
VIREAFDRLSPQTRYMRYGIPVRDPELVLGWIAELDGFQNCAIGAFLPTTGALIGGARYATVPDRTYAEVAEVIVDAWQGQRIGPRLLTELIRHAQRSGTAPLRASVLPDNKRAQRMLRAFGGWQLRSRRDGFMEYEFVALLPAADSPHVALLA